TRGPETRCRTAVPRTREGSSSTGRDEAKGEGSARVSDPARSVPPYRTPPQRGIKGCAPSSAGDYLSLGRVGLSSGPFSPGYILVFAAEKLRTASLSAS